MLGRLSFLFNRIRKDLQIGSIHFLLLKETFAPVLKLRGHTGIEQALDVIHTKMPFGETIGQVAEFVISRHKQANRFLISAMTEYDVSIAIGCQNRGERRRWRVQKMVVLLILQAMVTCSREYVVKFYIGD